MDCKLTPHIGSTVGARMFTNCMAAYSQHGHGIMPDSSNMPQHDIGHDGGPCDAVIVSEGDCGCRASKQAAPERQMTEVEFL